MTREAVAGRPAGAVPWAGRASGWLRASRGGLFAVALVVGAGSGLGAVAFRYLIYFFTWLATGHAQFGQQGRVASAHFPGLGLGFFVVIPVISGLIYGPLIYRYAREARGHGVPEVMIAVAEGGGRIRPQVAAVKSLASALCIGTGGSVGREGPIVQIGSALASSLGQWVKMPESRLRILVACGATGGISATFNAPLTGVFFGVEIILREFSIEAIFTVMLSAMIADLIRRLHPHPAGHARRRHRHRPVPGTELRHHLHHQAAAPRHRHRPPPSADASRTNTGSCIRRAAPTAGPRPDAAQQLAPPGPARRGQHALAPLTQPLPPAVAGH
jgi:H+/Cl- antiporter ClcA